MNLLYSRAEDWDLALGPVLKRCDGGSVFLDSLFKIHVDVFSVFVDGAVAADGFVACFTKVLEYLKYSKGWPNG